ncbi:MAG: hypothetical protein COB66_01360 [Coxiella sp. (in: Bacteria)]|nr:MAG: hypothetical protein COB66_01360 [Coxiella sp. (in: g-proteobacteria)]
MSNFDDLLDSTLDDLDDLPSFEPYPVGAHKVLATLAFKNIKTNEGEAPDAIELAFSYLEAVELADAQAEAPKAESKCSILFMLDNEFGRGNLKKCAMPLQAALGTASIRSTVEECNDVECIIMTSLRKDKNDPDKIYLQVKEIAVV